MARLVHKQRLHIAHLLAATPRHFGLPIFAALIMAEPVKEIFRLEINPSFFSKPVSRAQYLLGNSLAATSCSFVVRHLSQRRLFCFRSSTHHRRLCSPPASSLFQPFIIMIVVITYVLFAAVYFTVGTLTQTRRSFTGWQLLIPPPLFLWVLLERLTAAMASDSRPLMRWKVQIQPWGRSPEWGIVL